MPSLFSPLAPSEAYSSPASPAGPARALVGITVARRSWCYRTASCHLRSAHNQHFTRRGDCADRPRRRGTRRLLSSLDPFAQPGGAKSGHIHSCWRRSHWIPYAARRRLRHVLAPQRGTTQCDSLAIRFTRCWSTSPSCFGPWRRGPMSGELCGNGIYIPHCFGSICVRRDFGLQQTITVCVLAIAVNVSRIK